MLKTVLRLNAASCLGFGALFLVAPGAVAAFLGDAPVWLVAALGLGLLANAAHLALASCRSVSAFELRWFAMGDFLWVAGTALLLLAGIWITTPGAIVAALAVALMVASFGLLQWRLAQEAAAGQAAS